MIDVPEIKSYHVGLLGGMVIGLPPVLNFAKPELRDKVVPEVLSGKKVRSCFFV
jgi:hypothetical protein